MSRPANPAGHFAQTMPFVWAPHFAVGRGVRARLNIRIRRTALL